MTRRVLAVPASRELLTLLQTITRRLDKIERGSLFRGSVSVQSIVIGGVKITLREQPNGDLVMYGQQGEGETVEMFTFPAEGD